MKPKALLTIVSVFLLIVGCATENSNVIPPNLQEMCNAPIWKVGDSWRYKRADKKEAGYTVVGLDEFRGSKIYVVDSYYGDYKKGIDTKTLQFKVDIDRDGKKVSPARLLDWASYYDFPLYVGKKWQKAVTGSNAEGGYMDYIFVYKVLSLENITVPAGTFKAYKIEKVQSFQRGGSSTTYVWYSPEVKWEVKYQPGTVDGLWKIEDQGYELKTFKCN